jgi:hypothetical protein
MGRPPIRKKGAMTAADRQRRRRKPSRERAEQILKQYIPMPPGISYWDQVEVETPEGPRKVWTPRVKPLASIAHNELTDEEILELLRQLKALARQRNLM